MRVGFDGLFRQCGLKGRREVCDRGRTLDPGDGWFAAMARKYGVQLWVDFVSIVAVKPALSPAV